MLPRPEPLPAAGLPRHRAVVALDIERSTSRPDPVKAELRSKLYGVFDAALLEAGIRRQYRDRFVDRGDGILALIHPVDQAPKAALLKTVIPALSQLLTDYNASLPQASRAQRQLRIRAVVHAGEVHYDANGCFGEALDIAFRLLDATHVKKALQATADPLTLVISDDIYRAIVRHCQQPRWRIMLCIQNVQFCRRLSYAVIPCRTARSGCAYRLSPNHDLPRTARCQADSVCGQAWRHPYPGGVRSTVTH
jgi:class 3 adenylate cyclase